MVKITNARAVKSFIEKINKWWEEHAYDTTGDYGEYNVFDSDPEFVEFAELIQNKTISIMDDEYSKYEFCKDIKCPELRNGKCDRNRYKCIQTAKDFHKWLKGHDYKIIKKEKSYE